MKITICLIILSVIVYGFILMLNLRFDFKGYPPPECSDNKRYVFWEDRFQELAQYNAEVGRGILHTPEMTDRMKTLQQEFNDKQLYDTNKRNRTGSETK